MPSAPRFAADDRDFLKLWSGSLVSTFGFHVTALAMQLTAVSVLGATPFEMGILGAAQYGPRFLLGLVAGAWVDRLRRRPILIAADVGRGVLLGSIPLAYLAGRLSVEQLWVVGLGMGGFSTFFETAVFSYLPSLVSRDGLLQANTRMHAGEAVAQIVGPNLAGLLVQTLTAPIAIGFDAISYVVSAVCVAWIRRPEPEPAPAPPTAGDRSLVGEIRAGVDVVLATPLLRAPLAAQVTLTFFSGGIRGSLIVLYLVQIGVSPIEFGLIYGVGGAAALVGALIARPVAEALGLGRVLVGIHLVAAAFAAFVPLAGVMPGAVLPVLLAGQVGLGVTAPIWGVNSVSLAQAVTPHALLGRVNATQRFASYTAQPLGAIGGGLLATAIGLQATLAVAALGVALGSVWLALTGIRRLRRLPGPSPEAAAAAV